MDPNYGGNMMLNACHVFQKFHVLHPKKHSKKKQTNDRTSASSEEKVPIVSTITTPWN